MVVSGMMERDWYDGIIKMNIIYDSNCRNIKQTWNSSCGR